MIEINRKTNETDISVAINLQGTGSADINTGISFLDHMLEQFAKHSLIDLKIKAAGDIHIDYHHTVEDIGITLGQAFSKAVGDKKGINRFGFSYVPLDEALTRVVIDLSGRPNLDFNVNFTKSKIGNFDSELFREFFQGFVNHSLTTLHIDNLKGINAHHQAESIFKALAKAVKSAINIDKRLGDNIASTKGIL